MTDATNDEAGRRRTERLRALVVPEHTAVLVQEVQNGVVGSESGLPELAAAGREVGLIEHVATVVGAARGAGVRVVHCTAENLPEWFGSNRNGRLFMATRASGMANLPGSEAVQPVPDVIEPGDVVLPRYHGLSPLTGGPADHLLRNEGITTLVVVGVSLNVAIPNLVFDAVNRSYQVVVVSDAVAGVPVEYGRQVLANTIGLIATLATTDELVATWAASGGEG